jgi:hypothetical protein
MRRKLKPFKMFGGRVMSFHPPKSVISGVAYAVLDVGERSPTSIQEFVGVTRFTIDNHGPYVVRGCGALSAGRVRFYEKDHGGDGRDVRVWQITASGEAGFTAEHAAAW